MKKFTRMFVATFAVIVMIISSTTVTAMTTGAIFDDATYHTHVFDACCHHDNMPGLDQILSVNIPENLIDIMMDMAGITSEQLHNEEMIIVFGFDANFIENLEALTSEAVSPRIPQCCSHMSVAVVPSGMEWHVLNADRTSCLSVNIAMVRRCVSCGSSHGTAPTVVLNGCGWRCPFLGSWAR